MYCSLKLKNSIEMILLAQKRNVERDGEERKEILLENFNVLEAKNLNFDSSSLFTFRGMRKRWPRKLKTHKIRSIYRENRRKYHFANAIT